MSSRRTPKVVSLFFFTEMLSSSAITGMRHTCTFPRKQLLLIYSFFSSNFMVVWSGWIGSESLVGMADRYWGQSWSVDYTRRITAKGCRAICIIFCGYLQQFSHHVHRFWDCGFGNGFFKPNISTMVWTALSWKWQRIMVPTQFLYRYQSRCRFIAPLICGYLGENIAFKWGFLRPVLEYLMKVQHLLLDEKINI